MTAALTVALAVGAVGAGSLLFRLLPFVGAGRIPAHVARAAGWAGLSVLAALVVRAVVGHQDPGVPGAPYLAGLALIVALALAHRSRSALVSVAGGALTYLALAAAVAAL
jgi:branched-subunit amino acid transport protein